MTKPDCRIEIVEQLRSAAFGGVCVVRRVDCRNERTYTDIDVAMVRGTKERLAPPPCTCKPMVEPFEMI